MTEETIDFTARKFEQIRGDAAMAIGALGIALTKTLLECEKPISLELLRHHAGQVYEHLRGVSPDAMVMFGTFNSALWDAKIFPPKEE